MSVIDRAGNDTRDVCLCGHTRFEHYCFGGYCLRESPSMAAIRGCREFRQLRAATMAVMHRPLWRQERRYQ